MDLFSRAKNNLISVYKPFPIDVDKGKGVYLYDKDGTCYLDFLAGIAVNALGYQHPAINEAILKQIKRNLHLSNYFVQDVQISLAERLLSLTPFSKLFFTNSGTEAIEGLLKLVKKWGNEHNKKEIIAFSGSFHGRSLGALSITMQDKHQKHFLPLLPNVIEVPFDDTAAFEAAINENTLAVFYEGITGEGGVRPVSRFMLDAMKAGREKYGYLLVADEIQTGVGRTGSFYYFEQTDLIPDALATAKGLGGGLPLGAFLVNEKLQDVFQRGHHGTTYGGNPLACATGLAAVEIISNQVFLDSVQQKGSYFKGLLYELANDFNDVVSDVRGEGLMLGVEVGEYALDIMNTAFKNGLLFNVAGGNTLRFIPPLIVERNDIDAAYEKIRLTFKSLFR